MKCFSNTVCLKSTIQSCVLNFTYTYFSLVTVLNRFW
jgi:hypothetical protein